MFFVRPNFNVEFCRGSAFNHARAWRAPVLRRARPTATRARTEALATSLCRVPRSQASARSAVAAANPPPALANSTSRCARRAGSSRWLCSASAPLLSLCCNETKKLFNFNQKKKKYIFLKKQRADSKGTMLEQKGERMTVLCLFTMMLV